MEKRQAEYNFKIVEIGGIPYRMPQIRVGEDRGKRAEESFAEALMEEREVEIEQCKPDVDSAMKEAFHEFTPSADHKLKRKQK
jgi:hypothetical protein